MRVLIAEDKPRMADLLRRALRREGYVVSVAHDGEQALTMGMLGGLDLMVLDVMMPGRDGLEVIKQLRAAKQMTPAILVTARDSMADMVRGLDSGADDYLTKPFALDVLLARMRALARRGPATYPDDLQFEDLTLNRRTHELERGNRRVALTRTEYSLLEVLMRRAGSIARRTLATALFTCSSALCAANSRCPANGNSCTPCEESDTPCGPKRLEERLDIGSPHILVLSDFSGWFCGFRCRHVVRPGVFAEPGQGSHAGASRDALR
jgi:two-component system OmpR family response regulator